MPKSRESADDFINYLVTFSFESLTEFVQSMVLLISTPSQAIIISAMTMLGHLIKWCSDAIVLALVKTDLIPQLINTLNSLPLSLTESIHIHFYLLFTIFVSFCLSTSEALSQLENEDGNEQQAIHEVVLKQVLEPSEKYFCHFCVNRFSIIDESLEKGFMLLLANLLLISPYYQPTMDFVLNMPVVLTIPSCLTFFEKNGSLSFFLFSMIDSQYDWDEKGGKERMLWNEMLRMLRMEGLEDVIEEKLQNDQSEDEGIFTRPYSIDWNNMQGMNLPEQE
ncbi:hypothetical protein BLNAU_12363 [Blattamonas nauphoetae]|uniref:Uncharacterized protein n=1 Tax=Blattamonas nauphoetae TaxID=2049346 RepID=A0ABQ9XLU4_9EUKA|nr:hypothetical protein BLNAU_12363 [Blattamonas nauphoetae]